MAVTTELKGVKVILNLEKGTQTISNCNPTASDDNLALLGQAVATLTKYPAEEMVKQVQNVLIPE